MNGTGEHKSNFRSLLPKIFSVIAAVILWFYVVDVRTTTEEKIVYGVPISINNFSHAEGFDIISGKDHTVDVVVRGLKSDISDVTANDLYASVDMSGIDMAGSHKLDVNVESLKSGVTVINKTVSVINVNVDKNVSFVVPVEPVIIYTIEEDVYEMETPKLSFESVRVTGPQNIVDTVKTAKAEKDIGKVQNSITTTAKLRLYDEAGNLVDSPYVKLAENVVKVEIPVYKSEVKAVVPHFTDSDYKYEYTVSPAEILVKGDVKSVEKIKNVLTENIAEISPSKVVKRLDLDNSIKAYDLDGNAIDTVTVSIKSVIDLTAPKPEEADGEEQASNSNKK